MLRTWKLVAAHAIVGAAFVAPSAPAQENKNRDQKIDEIQLDVRDISKTITEMDKRIAAIQAALKDIETKTDLAKNQQVADLKDQIAQLRTVVDQLRPRLQDGSRVSAFGPPVDQAPPLTGRIQLVNQYPTMMSVTINRVSHRLMPSETEVVQVPAGTFSYEVLGVTPQRIRTVNANETFTVQIYPQP